MTQIRSSVLYLAVALAGCGSGEAGKVALPADSAGPVGPTITVRDTIIAGSFEAAGVAEPIERATLSTKLMGSVTAVLVREGDRVGRGQLLAKIDARDVKAKGAQVDASIAAAEAVYQDAKTQAARFRALYADSAATRYQLDQVETGLARAEAGLKTAGASRAELDAVGSYADIRAPFGGIVTHRYVDPGAFAAPGTPIIDLQDASRLRVSVTVAPGLTASLKKGQPLEASIEGRTVQATLEGAVPASSGAVYTVNAIVPNPKGELLAGSAATIRIPEGTRSAILVPASALVHEGDLTGVRVQSGGGSELRWVVVGSVRTASLVEVSSGLKAGDVILAGSH
jgi:RND family efflux transporter MFP subunit